MAFFGIRPGKRGPGRRTGSEGVSDAFLHAHGCAVCPLNGQRGVMHQSMPARGAKRPDVYFLGEAPGGEEDRKGRPFVGAAGRVLWRHVPEAWLPRIRYSNCVRTRPPDNRTPTRVEVECCRPSVQADILEASPQAIIGFGNVPLSWVGIASSGIRKWTGKRVPVLVGGRPIWYFPVVHPSAIQRDPQWRGIQARQGKYGSEFEFQFAQHLAAALEAVDARLPEPVVHTRDDAVADVSWVTGAGGDADVDRVVAHLELAASRKLVGFDYETNATRPYGEGAKVLTVAVSASSRDTLAFPIRHRAAAWTRKQLARVEEAWRWFLHEARCRKVAHNLSFEQEWSAAFYGIECLRGSRWGDSMAQAYVLDERQGTRSLEFLVQQYFGLNIKAMAGVNVTRLDDEPLADVLRYNGVDAKYHLLLYRALTDDLRAAGLQDLYRRHLERVTTATLTQLKGVPVDQAVVREMGERYLRKMASAEKKLRALPEVVAFERATREKFRPSANGDVSRIIKDLGYEVSSVDEAALASVKHPFARRLISWRKPAKVFSTYVARAATVETRRELDALRPGAFDGVDAPHVYPDGYMHPSTKVSWTRTSRTSAEDPNYQNWPKRGASGAKEVRGIVTAPPGHKIVAFDYGQIQARNVGMESLDRALLKAFWEDYDIHFAFMEHLARIYPPWVKEGVKQLAQDKDLVKKYRNDVKHGFVFASFFGAGPNKTSSVLRIPREAAEALGEIFWDQFGGIREWHVRAEYDYYRTGYVTGLSGYRRRAPVSYNERINAPIQADEAEIVMDAMTRLSKIDHDLLQATMEIHDDLTFVWPTRRVDELAEVVVRTMLEVPHEWARVTPIVVEMEVGDTWASMGGGQEFVSHRYEGINMPKECPI